jgi:hypothetical protein
VAVTIPNASNLTGRALDAASAKLGNITSNLTDKAVDAASARVTNATSEALSNASPGMLSMLALIPVRYWDFVSAPFTHPAMQWIIIPLMLTFMLTEFYFFRHPDEELGWNTALMNSLVLVFVAIDLTKTVFEHQTPVQVAKLFIVSLRSGENLGIFLTISFIGILGLGLAFINYFHLLPRKMAYLLSSHAPINFIALTAIVSVYTSQSGDPFILDMAGVVAAVLVFTTIVGTIFTMQRYLGSKDLSMYKRA